MMPSLSLCPDVLPAHEKDAAHQFVRCRYRRESGAGRIGAALWLVVTMSALLLHSVRAADETVDGTLTVTGNAIVGGDVTSAGELFAGQGFSSTCSMQKSALVDLATVSGANAANVTIPLCNGYVDVTVAGFALSSTANAAPVATLTKRILVGGVTAPVVQQEQFLACSGTSADQLYVHASAYTSTSGAVSFPVYYRPSFGGGQSLDKLLVSVAVQGQLSSSAAFAVSAPYVAAAETIPQDRNLPTQTFGVLTAANLAVDTAGAIGAYSVTSNTANLLTLNIGASNDATRNGVAFMKDASTGMKLGLNATGTTTALNVYNTTNTALLTVLDNGNVGIGTTTPQAPLDIQGKALFNPQVANSSTAVAYSFDTANALTTNSAKYFVIKNSGTEVFSLAKGMVGSDNATEIRTPYTTRFLTNGNRLDFDARPNGTVNFYGSNGYFALPFCLIRQGDASSTATQKGAYNLMFQNSLWSGTAVATRYSYIQNIPSTTVNANYRFAFAVDRMSDGTKLEAISIDNAAGNVTLGAGATTSTVNINGTLLVNGSAVFAGAGTNSFAIGDGCSASGTGAVALGVGSVASGNGSTAMGGGVVDTGYTILGGNCTASGLGSTASGGNSNAIGDFSIAMGESTNAYGPFSIAMGIDSIATGHASTAMGGESSANGFFSTAIGFRSQADGVGTVSLGYASVATGTSSIALGLCARANGHASLATGCMSGTDGKFSTAIGLNTNASGDCSVAMGGCLFDLPEYSFTPGVASSGPAASGTAAIAMGYVSSATTTLRAEGTASVAIGQDVNALTNNNVIVIGKSFSEDTPESFNVGFGQRDLQVTTGTVTLGADGNSTVQVNGTLLINGNPIPTFAGAGSGSFAAGNSSSASGDYSTAMGYSSAYGGYSTAMGFSSASGDYSTAMGFSSASGYGVTTMGNGVADGQNSTAMGFSSASGDCATAMGYSSACGNGATAMGYETNAGSHGAIAAGYNDNFDGSSFVAGGGSRGLGQIAMGYASNGNTLKAEGTASVAIGQDVNALTNDNVIVIGKAFTSTTSSSFNVGFGQCDFQVTSSQVHVTGNAILGTSTANVIKAKGKLLVSAGGGIPMGEFTQGETPAE